MLEPLTIAVAQPPCVPCDVAANVLAHAAVVRGAGARVVVFPELSLTGYELADAPLLDPNSLDLSNGPLAALIDACADVDAVAFVGAPVADEAQHHFIATIAVSGAGAVVAYRKRWLGADERERFTAGDDVAVHDVDGWRLGLAICKDTGVAEHTAAVGSLNVDVYIAGLVMYPSEADEQADRARRIAAELDCYVAFSGFAGATGSGYAATAGRSAVWAPGGAVLAGVDDAPGQVARIALQPRR